jgi:hypothetical protein
MAVFPVDEQADMVRRIATVDHPGRPAILNTIAFEHPEPKVAAAAHGARQARGKPKASKSRKAGRGRR